MKSARIRAYLMLLAVSIIWGIASPVIKYTLVGFPAALFLAYRFGISTILAIIIFAINGIHLPKNWNTVMLIFLYGFLNSVVSLGFLFFGMEHTSVLEAGLITMSSPLIVSTAGVYFLHEHITKREKFGMAIAILGTALTIIGPLITNGHSELKFTGNLMVFGYVISTLITTLIVKKLLREGVHAMTMTNISFIVGFFSFLTVLIYTKSVPTLSSITSVPLSYHYGVFYMAVISGTIAFWLSNKAQKSIEIGEQSLFAYLYPVFSLPLAIVWLGEKITTIHIVGAIIIIIGVIIAESKRQNRSIAEIKKKRYNTTSRR